MSPDKRVSKLRRERRALDAQNRDMEKRLDEIKALFEKEAVKTEKERLIWASAAQGHQGRVRRSWISIFSIIQSTLTIR